MKIEEWQDKRDAITEDIKALDERVKALTERRGTLLIPAKVQGSADAEAELEAVTGEMRGAREERDEPAVLFGQVVERIGELERQRELAVRAKQIRRIEREADRRAELAAKVDAAADALVAAVTDFNGHARALYADFNHLNAGGLDRYERLLNENVMGQQLNARLATVLPRHFDRERGRLMRDRTFADMDAEVMAGILRGLNGANSDKFELEPEPSVEVGAAV